MDARISYLRRPLQSIAVINRFIVSTVSKPALKAVWELGEKASNEGERKKLNKQ